MKKYNISIYLIVPFVFLLISIFSFVVSYQITKFKIELIIVSGFFVSMFSACLGYVIIKFILKPSEQFVENIRRSSSILNDSEGEESKNPSIDNIEELSKVFDQVYQALGVLDAENLFPDVIGRSKSIRQVLSQIMKVAHTDSTVLILGESGTGKELIAASIVNHSKRKDGPFVKVNCAAISPGLMESELFGHERGAFTGAISKKHGCFEQAHGGTLFLDEIGDMSSELQVKLLRVLQEQEFVRVGGSSSIHVDVRIIAATNKSFESMIADGSFREDLYYRINVFPIKLPPLRDRSEDIIDLTNYFIKKIDSGKILGPDAKDLLESHMWPGNVRELENIIERAMVLSGTNKIITSGFFPSLLNKSNVVTKLTTGDGEKKNKNLNEVLVDVEKKLICEALKKNKGVQVRAAEKLGINQRSLWNRIKKYEIDVSVYKDVS